MAENRDNITSLDFGIESTGVAGNVQAVEAFLSGDDSAMASDPNDVTPITEDDKKKEAAKKVKEVKTVAKKEDEVKEEEKEFDPLGEDFKDDEEDEETPKSTKVKAAVEKTEDKEEEEKEEKEEEASTGFNEYQALATDLFKAGVFTQTEDEEDVSKLKLDTPEAVMARFHKEGQIKATQFLEGVLTQFGEDRRELFEAVFIDGVDPREYLPVYNNVQDMTGLDITKEDVQEKVFREYYKRIGWNTEQIEKKLTRVKEYGDLSDESQELYPQLLEQDKANMEEQRAERARTQALQERIDREYKTSIAKILEEKAKNRDFDGIPINDVKKTKAFDFLYTKKYKAADGQLLTEFDKFIIDTRRPENHALRVKIALLALDGFDLTKVEKRAVSKESSAIFSELASKKVKKTGGTVSSKDTPEGKSKGKTSAISSWFD